MSETLIQLLPVIATLAGALVGGIVGAMGALFQGSRDRRRATRLLLYQLLKIRFSIKRLDPDRFITVLQRFVEKKFGREASQQIENPAAKTFFLKVWQLLTETLEPVADHQRYAQAVESLAAYDPFLAYRLSSQDRLAQYGRTVKAYYDHVRQLPEMVSDPDAPSTIQALESATLRIARLEALGILRDDILSVARRISVIARWSAHRTLNRQDRERDTELEQELDEMLTDVLKTTGLAGAA